MGTQSRTLSPHECAVALRLPYTLPAGMDRPGDQLISDYIYSVAKGNREAINFCYRYERTGEGRTKELKEEAGRAKSAFQAQPFAGLSDLLRKSQVDYLGTIFRPTSGKTEWDRIGSLLGAGAGFFLGAMFVKQYRGPMQPKFALPGGGLLKYATQWGIFLSFTGGLIGLYSAASENYYKS